MPMFGSRETPEQREERRAFERWAKDALRRARERFRLIANTQTAELFLELLLSRPENLREPALTRIYAHRDAEVAVELADIEAGILAEQGYRPVSSVAGVTRSSLGGITMLGTFEQQTLTVTYERRGAGGG